MLLSIFSIRKTAGCLLTLFLTITFSVFTQAAPTTSELDDLFAIKLLAFEQKDKGGAGGNPNLAEDASIYQGVALLKRRISDSDLIQLQGLWDEVSAASYDDAKDKASIISGATGYNPGRWGLTAGWTHEMADFDFSINAGYGQEFAYRAHNVGFGLRRSLAEGSTQLSVDVQLFDDEVRVFRWDGSQEPDDLRKTRTVNFGIVQTLTPVSAVNLGWSHTAQSGFLATSFNSVLVGTNREFESVPDKRRRDAISIRYKHALQQNSIQLGFGYYWDNWGIDSSTVELRYYYWSNERIMLEPHLRLYTQSPADFFADTFASTQNSMSSDSDLGDFQSYSTGLLIHFFGARLLGYNQARLDLGLNYNHRSDDLNFYWMTFGASIPL